GPPPDQALHAQHELVAHAVGCRESFSTVGIADHLHQSFAIAQVDEDHAAMVAAAMGPAEERDGLAEETGIGETAVFGAHMCRTRAGGRPISAHWVPVDTGMTAGSGAGK